MIGDEADLELPPRLNAVFAPPRVDCADVYEEAARLQLVVYDVLYAEADVALPEADSRVAQTHVLGVVLRRGLQVRLALDRECAAALDRSKSTYHQAMAMLLSLIRIRQMII